MSLIPTVSLTTVASSANEGGSNGTYRISRNNTLGNLVVKLKIDNSSSASSSDYTLNGGGISISGNEITVVIPAGQSFVDISLIAIDDIQAEADETLKLNLAQGLLYLKDSTKNTATVTINRNDTVVINTNDSGEGSLRQAIENANVFAGSDTVSFALSVFTDTTPDTITLTSGQLTISDDVIIQGTGANQLTVSGNNANRVFNTSGNLTDATIDSLTIANGNAGSGDGGGILVNSNNTLTLTKSIVSNNTAILGGGIANFGTVTLTDSTVSNNMANAVGGGIYNEGPATLSNSTLSNNISNAAGGGIYNVRTVNVTNSTFSGNATNTSGGGIANFGTAVTLINSTLTNNTADVDNNGDGEGGGIAQFSGTFTTKNTIIAGNFDAGSEAPDVFGNVTGDANNLIGSTSGAAGSIGTGTDIVNPNPGLGALQNNGGFTQTHALLANSPAINGGNNANIPPGVTTDQRGNGFDRIKFGTVDIGAFEVQQPILSIIATAPTATEDGNVGTYRISRTNSNGNLTVKLTIDNSSSASVGDYTFNSGSVTVSGNNLTIVIPDGQNFIDINLSAVNDIAAEADETLKLSLVTDAAYSIDTANPNASVTIARNDTVVTNTNDSGEGSLRQAILNANAFAGADIVGFDTAGVFATDQTITLTSGQLTITDDVTIEGTKANNLTVSGNNTFRSFLISRAGTDAILDSLTIANGNAGDANGGGIFVSSGTTLLLTNSNISENQAAAAGGIYNLGIATIINSTLSNNQASFNGGAIYNIGTATITNSTVSGNQANDLGGGIHNLGTAIINNSTITNNTADADNDGDSRGGGIFNPSGTVVLKNTIIAGNVDNSNQAPDVFGNITGDGNNLIGTTAGASGTVGTGSDITFASAGITNINQVIETSLQNNGGKLFHI